VGQRFFLQETTLSFLLKTKMANNIVKQHDSESGSWSGLDQAAGNAKLLHQRMARLGIKYQINEGDRPIQSGGVHQRVDLFVPRGDGAKVIQKINSGVWLEKKRSWAGKQQQQPMCHMAQRVEKKGGVATKG
jgi:hypothetical protein